MTTLPQDIFCLIFFTFIYCLFFTSFFFRKKYVFLNFLLSFILLYDFVFINVSGYLSPMVFYIVKSWQEYLTIFLIGVLTLSRQYRLVGYNRFDFYLLFSLLLLTITGMLAGIKGGSSIGEAFLGWRMYLLPFVWGFLLYKTGVFNSIKAEVPIRYFLTISVVIIFFAIFQENAFDGNLKKLWFHDFIDKLNPIAEHEFDFIRDDKLRATGIFVSPLIYSTFLSFGQLLIIFKLLISDRRVLSDILLVILFSLLCYGQILSRTRIGFIIFAVATGTSLLIYFRPKTNFVVTFLLPAGFAIFTIFLLIVGITDDPSALGRLVQYASLPTYFTPMGLGFGSDETNVLFDSYYISVVVLFGLFIPVLILLYLRLLKRLQQLGRMIRNEGFSQNDRIFFYAGFGYCFSFLYTFAFHFSTGSASFQLLILLLFFFLSIYFFKRNTANAQ